MNKQYHVIVFSLMILIIVSCGSNSIIPFNGKNGDNNENKENSIYQVPGCASEGLSKQASTLQDSSFTYQFDEELFIEFCVTANCCPDVNRFDLSWQISSDTINIAVQDTAANACFCVCPYLIHLNLVDLSFDKYSVVVEYNDQTAYSEPVVRQ